MQTTAVHEHCIFIMVDMMVFFSSGDFIPETFNVVTLHYMLAHQIDCKQAIKQGIFVPLSIITCSIVVVVFYL